MWAAVFRMCDLFQKTALDLACRLGLVYDAGEAQNSRRWLEYVHDLPSGASELTPENLA